MKPRTMERLDLLAAESERRLLDEIKRHNATLAQVAQQRGVLAAYRERLSDSWCGGQAVHAGQARRAGHFAAASRSADVQIDQMEAQARQQLEAALVKLAKTQAHRQGLSEASRKAMFQLEREAAQQRERAQPWRPHPSSNGFKK
jgi:hypothetical protein